MARPSDWHVLDLDADPVPGDPWRVKELGRLLRGLADDADSAARTVRGLVGDHAAMNWIGAAGDAFKEHIGKFPGQLDKVANSHHMCADALVAYGDSLDGAQSQADRALVQARPLFDKVQSLRSQLATANTNATSASKSYTTLTGGSTAPDSTALAAAVKAKTDSQHSVDTLNSQLSGPEAQLEALKKLAHQAAGLRDNAEDTAQRQINAATDAGIPPDSFWHKLGDLCATLWHGLVLIAKIVSFIGAIVLMIVGGPLWLIVAVVVAGLIILADTLYKYSQGKASLWDVGLSILGCIPITKGLTSLGALRDAFEAGGFLNAGLHLGGALLSPAKSLITGGIDLLRGGGGLLRNSVDFLGELSRGESSIRIPPPSEVLDAVKALAPKVLQGGKYTAEDGHYYATRVLEGGRADGETVLAGHGVYYEADGFTVVPEGTRVAMYCPHDAVLPGMSGVAVEGGVYPGLPLKIFEAGEQIPNYTLKAPAGGFGQSFTVFQNSTTVADATKLADLLKTDGGLIHWAACREVVH